MNTSSMVPLSTKGGHSSQVNMCLLLGGLSLEVEQMGPDFVLLETPINHPQSIATLILQVDESERRWNVHLPQGISATQKRVQIAPTI